MSLDQTDVAERFAQNEERIRNIKAEVDSLQINLMGAAKPWYKQVATLVAVTALAFSFGTTFVSYYRTAQLDRHAAQVELRSLIQRITALPRENFELIQKYQDNPLQAQSLSGFLNNENLIIVQQAAEILRQIPDLASAGEYFAVAEGLVGSGLTERAKELYGQSAARATNSAAAVAAYRSLAALAYQEGRIDVSRGFWETAMKIFETRFQNVSPLVQNDTHTFTKLVWAQTLISKGECKEGVGHLEEAERYLSSLPESPRTASLHAAIQKAKAPCSLQ